MTLVRRNEVSRGRDSHDARRSFSCTPACIYSTPMGKLSRYPSLSSPIQLDLQGAPKMHQRHFRRLSNVPTSPIRGRSSTRRTCSNSRENIDQNLSDPSSQQASSINPTLQQFAPGTETLSSQEVDQITMQLYTSSNVLETHIRQRMSMTETHEREGAVEEHKSARAVSSPPCPIGKKLKKKSSKI